MARSSTTLERCRGRSPARASRPTRVSPTSAGPNGVWTKNPAAEIRPRCSTTSPIPGAPGVAQPAREPGLDRGAAPVTVSLRSRSGNSHTRHPERRRTPPACSVVTGQGRQVHGTMRRYECLQCGDTGPMAVVLERVRAGDHDPECLACSGIVKDGHDLFRTGARAHVLLHCVRQAASFPYLLLAGRSTLRCIPWPTWCREPAPAGTPWPTRAPSGSISGFCPRV